MLKFYAVEIAVIGAPEVVRQTRRGFKLEPIRQFYYECMAESPKIAAGAALREAGRAAEKKPEVYGKAEFKVKSVREII